MFSDSRFSRHVTAGHGPEKPKPEGLRIMLNITISVLVDELAAVTATMQINMEDDEMDDLVERHAALEDLILAAPCNSMDDFVAKRATMIEWTSLEGAIHRHERAVFRRLARDLQKLRSQEIDVSLA